MNIDFDKANGLVPTVVQDAITKNVLMLGYMNAEAVKETIATGKVTFYSRSKQRLWVKGETSDNFLMLKDLKVDCDNDALLIQAEPQGPTCHKGSDTCWGEENSKGLSFLAKLEGVINSRKGADPESSYTASLLNRGINKVAQKVGEEAVEVVIEAKDNDDNLFKNEVADLIYHLLVLLTAKDVSLKEIMDTLEERHK